MPKPSASNRSERLTSLSSGLIEVVFHWQIDRWIHSLHACQPDGSRGPACWLTAPPRPDDDPQWPSSPPLVELADVHGPHSTALVGVGRAGTSHYSASITSQPDGGICFEIACRLRADRGWLGSTYLACPEGGQPRLTIEPLASHGRQAFTDTKTALGQDGPLLQIVPAAAGDDSAGRPSKGSTIQWGYRVVVSKPD